MRTPALLTGIVLALAIPFAGPAVTASAAADGCADGVVSDFNGDGWSDAVVGDPTATVNGLAGAGRIIVLYGDGDGRVGEGARDVLWQGEEAVNGTPEAGDGFGHALAVADLDCDDYTDVVVGTPLEDIGGMVDSGYVQVLWGGAAGLSISRVSTPLTQASFAQVAAAGDQFGFAVDAVEDVGQGGTPNPDAYALAIGVPGAQVSGHDDAGAVAVRAAYDGGHEDHWITEDHSGIPGAAEDGDRFGAAVSCAYLVGWTDLIDCAIGIPNEDVGSKADAGSVMLVQDIYYDDELTGIGLGQNAPGVPGSAEAGDYYGRSLDTVQVGDTARLAVGAPGEDVGSDANAGMVQLFSSDTEDLTIGTALTQDTPGVADATQAGDIFGDEVAWIAPGLGDVRTRLAVSAPKEDTASGANVGLVQVFPTNNLGAETTWTQASAGVPGGAEAGDLFGDSLAMVAGAGERVLLVGVPADVANPGGMVDVIPFGGGAPRAWVVGDAGIPLAGSDSFGASLGSVNGGSD